VSDKQSAGLLNLRTSPTTVTGTYLG